MSSSSVSTINYQKALDKAFSGEWQLPQFQRDVKWKVKQNILLFDSLRSDFPIGTFLTAKEGAITNVKPFNFSDDPSKLKKPELFELLLLDGQQRITAGIQLFYADKNKQGTTYYIDLNRLEALLVEYKAANKSFDIDDDDNIKHFSEELDSDSGYLVAKQNVGDPYSFFKKKGLVFTALLRKSNESHWDTYKASYLAKYPSNKRLIEIFQILFRGNVTFDPIIPNIVVDSKEAKVLTRIFSTLNNSGTSLTPFEITVSEMYGENIDLVSDINDFISSSMYLPRIDRDKNMILQACLMISGSTGNNHKKTNLPKSMNKDIWTKNKEDAFKSIEKLGEFLTKEMGVGLDHSSIYVPYDTALLPLIYIFNRYDESKMTNADRTSFFKIIKYYFVSSALRLRFTEGATSKQTVDKDLLVRAIDTKDIKVIDDSLDKQFYGLDEVTNSGAKGKIMLCIQNANHLKDVLTANNISLSKDHEIHHIFPQSLLKTFSNLKFSPNHIANLMVTDPATNKQFSHKDPVDQVNMSKSMHSNYKDLYRAHFVTDDALKLMEKPSKTREDYHKFIEERIKTMLKHVEVTYGINSVKTDLDDKEIDSDEDSI